jgi:hypothetical protein
MYTNILKITLYENKSICIFFLFLQFEKQKFKQWLQLLMACVNATSPNHHV